MTASPAPVVAWRGDEGPDRPLVVLLHGRGSDETEIIGLAEHLRAGAAYASVRAPIAEGGARNVVPAGQVQPREATWPADVSSGDMGRSLRRAQAHEADGRRIRR